MGTRFALAAAAGGRPGIGGLVDGRQSCMAGEPSCVACHLAASLAASVVQQGATLRGIPLQTRHLRRWSRMARVRSGRPVHGVSGGAGYVLMFVGLLG